MKDHNRFQLRGYWNNKRSQITQKVIVWV